MKKLTSLQGPDLLRVYRQRANSGPYQTLINSNGGYAPGEWADIETRASRFLIDPLAKGNSGVAGEQLWPGYSGSTIDPNTGPVMYPEYQGVDMLACAFRYAIKGVATDAQAVRTCLLAQVRMQTGSGYIGCQVSDWPTGLGGNGAVRPYNESGARESDWLKRLASAYLYTRSIYSSAEQQEIENWLKGWASYFASEIHNDLVGYTPGRLQGDYSVRTGFASDAGYSPGPGLDPIWQQPDDDRFDLYGDRNTIPLYINPDSSDGPLLSRIARFYNNRGAEKMGMIGLVAAITEDWELWRHPVAYIRDWFFYSVWESGAFGDYERDGNYANTIVDPTDPAGIRRIRKPGDIGFPSRGAMWYGSLILQNFLFLGYIEELCGASSLRDMAVTDGVHGTQSATPKTFRKVVDRYIDNLTGANTIYCYYVSADTRISGFCPNTVAGFTDTYVTWYGGICGLASLLYKDARYALASQAALPGMMPMPANGHTAAAQVAQAFTGTGAEWPAMFFLYAGLDVNAIDIALPTSPFDDLLEYFRNLAAAHVQVAGNFIHGDVRRFTNESRSKLKYPCLWLETPNQVVSTNGAGSNFVDSTGAFTILWNAPTSDYEKQDQIWADTNKIALDFITRLKSDAKKRVNNLISVDSFKLDAIDSLFVDNDYGWRVEFNLKKPINLCLNSDAWNDATE